MTTEAAEPAPLYVRVETEYMGGWDHIPTAYRRYDTFSQAWDSWTNGVVVTVDPTGKVIHILAPCKGIVWECVECAVMTPQHPITECTADCLSLATHRRFHALRGTGA